MTRCLTILVIALAIGTVGLTAGQIPPAKPAPQAPQPMTVQPIAKALYLVKGGAGANTAFFVGKKDVTVIDAKMTPQAAAEMLAAIAKVTPKPVSTIILTHSDGDHVNGLPGFPKGLRIIAQENVKRDLEKAAVDLPALRDYLPTLVYGLAVGPAGAGRNIELRYFGPAHTDGDTVVIFPSLKTVYVGDLLFVGRDPLIHRNKGGNSFGYVKTLDALLALKPKVETFLSGHADPLGRTEVQALRDSMAGTQAKVKALVAEGKSLDEVKRAFGIDDRPGPGGRRWPSLVEVIYLELTEKK
jgi:cyclase